MRARHCLVSSLAGYSQMSDELASQGLCRPSPLCFAQCMACSLALHADALSKLQDKAIAQPSACSAGGWRVPNVQCTGMLQAAGLLLCLQGRHFACDPI